MAIFYLFFIKGSDTILKFDNDYLSSQFGNITLSGTTQIQLTMSQHYYLFTVVGEQPYKYRDMVGSDSGLGHLLVSNITIITGYI